MTRRLHREPASFEPEIDKRVIQGFLEDRDVMLGELAKMGFSRGSVLRRAETLGLNRAFVAQCQAGGVNVDVRTCLRCDTRFVSLGPQNRLCKPCLSKL